MKCELVKKGEEKEREEVDGKTFRLMQKSGEMEAIIAELEPGVKSNEYRHKGEEIHLVLNGKIDYHVGDEVHRMEDGDTLWHPSDIPHHAKNIGDEKASYVTVSSPPTFM
ncbi:MAG: cupin domain-containing protein [Candidatus Natronoplasma sp.]